jgi:hypothetical protein
MEEERIELRAKERERLKVLHEVEQGHLLQIDAARRLRLSDRQVRRLLQRLSRRTPTSRAGPTIQRRNTPHSFRASQNSVRI